jgi:nickel/cobalt transporter (NiCoT) family protein
MRQGQFDEAELEQHLDKRGFLNRILGRATKAVTKPRHMYPSASCSTSVFNPVT